MKRVRRLTKPTRAKEAGALVGLVTCGLAWAWAQNKPARPTPEPPYVPPEPPYVPPEPPYVPPEPPYAPPFVPPTPPTYFPPTVPLKFAYGDIIQGPLGRLWILFADANFYVCENLSRNGMRTYLDFASEPLYTKVGYEPVPRYV